MTTRLYVANQQAGYIFIDGKLRAYQFISAKLDFENGEITYTCKIGGIEREFATSENERIYKDENAYKQGVALDNRIISWSKAINEGLHMYVGGRCDEIEDCTAWQIVGNEIMAVCPATDGYDLDADGRITHPLKDEYFTTKEDALLHLDVIKVDENGVETIIESPARKVALTPEQTTALDAVRTALDKAHELGIRFSIDNCIDVLYAYNYNNVKERTFDCGRDKICEWGYGINELMQKVGSKAEIIPISMDDCETFVRFAE